MVPRMILKEFCEMAGEGQRAQADALGVSLKVLNGKLTGRTALTALECRLLRLAHRLAGEIDQSERGEAICRAIIDK